MAATAAQIARLRRLCNLEVTDTTYTDMVLASYIELYPVVDAAGLESDETTWTATYNLYAAAVDVLAEKAGAAATAVDFSADGAQFQMSQEQRNLLKQIETYRMLADEKIATFPG